MESWRDGIVEEWKDGTVEKEVARYELGVNWLRAKG